MTRSTSAILCLASWLAVAQGSPWYAPEVGQPHADFVLPRIDSREAVSLSQYRGRKVLLIQFASW